MNEAAEQVRRTETGYLITTTLRETNHGAPRFVIRREPGRLREDDLAPSRTAVRRIAESTVDGVRWSLPDAAGQHEVPGEASAATLMLAGMPAPALARMFGPLGAALRAVHAIPSSGGPAPSGLRRLLRWLETGRGPGDSMRLHAVFDETEGLIAHLDSAAEELAHARAVTCLGAPGGNTIYPAPAGDHMAVLVTDEVAEAPPEWDLGWVLGEFLELANDPHLVEQPASLADHPVAAAVCEAYGAGLDRRLAGAAAVLRWAVHLHDFAAYVEWADDFAARAARLAEHAADLDGVLGGTVRRE